MEERVSRDKWPWWVRFGTFGLLTRTRTQLWFWTWCGLVVGAVVVILGIWGIQPYLIVIGLLTLSTAPLNWLVIRWIDRHGSWDT
jgi:hypothetical protein